MRTIRFQQAIVTHDTGWGKWPDTADADYTEVTNRRRSERFVRGDTEVLVETRWVPIFSAFAPYRPLYPQIDNTIALPIEVTMSAQRLLSQTAAECPVVIWEHGYGMHPAIAEILKQIFALSILWFSDDAPGTSEKKSFPAAGAFDALFHCMWIYDFNTGQRVNEQYWQRGLRRTYFKSNNESNGLVARLQHAGFTIDQKIEALRAGHVPTDIVFAGGMTGAEYRQRLLAGLNKLDGAIPFTSVLHGHGMRDGVVRPFRSAEGDGWHLAPLYARSKFGLNAQWSSLFNQRLIDLWLCGTAQIVFDPHNELGDNGFVPYEHYLPFDGSLDGLIATIKEWKAQPESVVQLIRRAHEKALRYQRERSTNEVVLSIYMDHIDKLTADSRVSIATR